MVAALLALAGCGANPEREKQAQELAAAEKKLAGAKTANEDMEREKQLVSTKLAEAQARLDEVRAAYHGTLAGAAYLADEGKGLTLTWEMHAAREGFLLAEAVRQKDKKAIEELGARVLADERPCAASAEDAENVDECGPCEVAPFEDACTEVATNTTSTPEWSCVSLERTGQGLPPAAFCTSSLLHPAPGPNVDSPYAEQNLLTGLDVVRVAFAHEGRLYVSDYPQPEPTLYNPPNVDPLVECKATTARNECIHQCEVKFNRYEDPCACESGDDPDDYHDHMGEEEESDEPAEVREARRAAAEAEAEAEAARQRAEEAQQEVAYQECRAACEPEPEPEPEVDAPEDAEAEVRVEPVSTTVTMSLEAAPAPGIFVVTRAVSALGPDDKALSETKSVLLLKNPGLVALWQKKALPPSETLGALEPISELDEVMMNGEKLALAPLPGIEGAALVGMRAGVVKAFALKTQAGQEPVVELATAATCTALRAEPKRFPEAYLKACAEPPAAATAAPAEADAGATPEAPADAGSAVDAGEVAP